MKKKVVVFLTIFALALSMMSFLAVEAAKDAEVKVVVNDDGTITVTATGTFEKGDWVGIYKQGETVDPNNGGATSLIWWYLEEGTEIIYPGENSGITVDTNNRPAELAEGVKGSALAPGDYYAVVLGGESSYEIFSEEFECTIPESDEEPTEAPATATPTPEPTEAPTEKATATATPTAKATSTAPAKATAGADADSDNNTLLLVVCIVAGVIIVAAVVVIIVVKKKKK